VLLTHELTDMLRRSRTIDWQKKESARAGMRRMVKKLLKNKSIDEEPYFSSNVTLRIITMPL
jgi:hypothetical protein